MKKNKDENKLSEKNSRNQETKGSKLEKNKTESMKKKRK